jgi:SET domain-containing protein
MPIKPEDLQVRRAATGLGLFSLRPIPAGRKIIEYLGPVLTGDEVTRKGGKYLFDLGGDRAIDGSARTNRARYLNHSCRPNAEAFITGRRVWIWSKRPIAAGDEITIHYGKAYFDEFIRPIGCKCPHCAARAEKKLAARKAARKKTAQKKAKRARA